MTDLQKAGDPIARTKAESPERMTALLLHKLRLLIESESAPDAKTLRDCVAVLKELTALTKEFTPPEDETGTGVIILPEVRAE